eukprot:XP_014791236.1 PREDICTED: metabotropic glutamate receptor 4-like isoform X2 [Octopus bimaculoides]
MVELVKMFNWTYVSVIYEESSYGIQGFNEVEKHLRDNGICIARTEKLLKDSGVAGTEAYDKIVDNLKLKSNARGVIIFASDQEVGELMLAVARRNATGMFSWIGSDGWGGRAVVYENKERQVEGAITVQPLAYDVKGFKKYFLSLSPKTNTRNPWFIEYWEQHFQCKYPNSSWTPFNEMYNETCTGNEVIDPDDFHLEAQLQFVSDAAMAFGYAFKAMHQDLCDGKPYLCDKMSPINGELLKQYLLKVDFQGLSGQNFTFLPNGDGPARYRILNYRQKSLNQFEWNSVGFFKDGKLRDMNMSMIQFRLEEPNHPESVCSKQCVQGQAKTFLKGHTCCWTCLNCTKYQFLPTKYECKDCPMGTLPSLNQTYCVKIAEIYLSVDDGIAIGAMVFSSLGIVASIFVIIVFIRYSATPVVKASGRELSFVLLIGIFMCYCMTFLVVAKPNAFTCGSQQFGIGLCFAITYAAILTKTNRIARIFRAGKRTAKRPKFISPRSQLFICGSLVSLQLAIGVIWLLMSPPKAIPFYANRNDHQLICKAAQGFSYMIGFSYPIFLVNICTVYAVLTRKIPEAFNESKYIGFTMYTTFIIWLAFVPIYFTTAHNIEVRMATMCFSISLSATVALVCMFTPKLYIILLHPEKNVRQSMMTSKVLIAKTNSSAIRVDSGTQSDEVEMTQRLKRSSSFSSLYSRSTNATQTQSFNGHSVSTQTLDSLGNEFDDHDVEL